MVTVLVLDWAIPSDARYVKVRSPTKDPPDVYVKLPFELTSIDPLPPSSTSTTVRLSPSASESLASTPGAGTTSSSPVVALYVSFAAVGATFVTVIETVAMLESPSRPPSTLYLNEFRAVQGRDVPGLRRVGISAVRVEGEIAVGHVGREHRGVPATELDVIAEHARGRHRLGAVVLHGHRVVDRDRRKERSRRGGRDGERHESRDDRGHRAAPPV